MRMFLSPFLLVFQLASHKAVQSVVFGKDLSRVGLGTGTGDCFERECPGTPTGSFYLDAIRAGTRLFDTAFTYGSEAPLGEALVASGIPRDHFFIIAKPPQQIRCPECEWHEWYETHEDCIKQNLSDNCKLESAWTVHSAFNETLKRLRTDFVDVLMVHHTDEESEHSFKAQWHAMEELMELGKVRYLGLRGDPLYWEPVGNVAGLCIACEFPRWARIKPSMVWGNYRRLRPNIERLPPGDTQLWKNVWLTSGGVGLYGGESTEMHRRIESVMPSSVQKVGIRNLLAAWMLCYMDAIFPESSKVQHVIENLAAAEVVLTEEELHQLSSITNEQIGPKCARSGAHPNSFDL